MKTKYLSFALFLFTAFISGPANSQSASNSFCTDLQYKVLYFKGVRTTREKAKFSVREIERAYNSTTDYRQNIEYSLVYNESSHDENSVTKTGWEDVLETFEQRFSQ